MLSGPRNNRVARRDKHSDHRIGIYRSVEKRGDGVNSGPHVVDWVDGGTMPGGHGACQMSASCCSSCPADNGAQVTTQDGTLTFTPAPGDTSATLNLRVESLGRPITQISLNVTITETATLR